jgi:ABC-type cobalamin/Fe3+-siderophores transport system ATPase subunit
MQKQKLSIHNFGPIAATDIEVNDILLLIGPQASGKSSIAKALYFFKSLRDDLLRYMLDAVEKKDFDLSVTPFTQKAKQKFLGIYGPVVRHFSDMELRYDYGNGISITVQMDPSEYTAVLFEGDFDVRFQQLMQEAQDFSRTIVQQNGKMLSSSDLITMEIGRRVFVENLSRRVNDIFNDSQEIIYIPAGRSLIATMSEQISNIELGENLDDLMRMFVRYVNSLRPQFSKGLGEMIRERQDLQPNADLSLAKEAAVIIRDILRGRYEYDSFGGERLYFDERGGYTKINYASSGQQESIWILFVVFLLILHQRRIFLVLEEPETHLYPEAQKQMVDLFALLANANQNQVVIATHSPYILSSFNNLLYAHTVGQQKSDEVVQVVPESTWIAPERLEGYMVANGQANSITDQESGLLDTAAIDSASVIILDIFNKLFDLEDA